MYPYVILIFLLSARFSSNPIDTLKSKFQRMQFSVIINEASLIITENFYVSIRNIVAYTIFLDHKISQTNKIHTTKIGKVNDREIELKI